MIQVQAAVRHDPVAGGEAVQSWQLERRQDQPL